MPTNIVSPASRKFLAMHLDGMVIEVPQSLVTWFDTKNLVGRIRNPKCKSTSTSPSTGITASLAVFILRFEGSNSISSTTLLDSMLNWQPLSSRQYCSLPWIVASRYTSCSVTLDSKTPPTLLIWFGKLGCDGEPWFPGPSVLPLVNYLSCLGLLQSLEKCPVLLQL